MSEEYTLSSFNATDFQDQNGNYWCNAAFQGVSEPIKWVVKDPTKITVGDKYYGRITDETSKANKPYRRFRRETAPEGSPAQVKAEQTDEYWAERNNAIRAQWAINQSREYIQHMLGQEAKLAEILDTAKLFYSMVDQVSGTEATNDEAVGKAVADMVDNGSAINLDEVPY